MRSSRALFSAFGAGLALAIAASTALLVVSSVVAFNGWPESDSAPKDPEVTQLKQVRAAAKAPAAVTAVALPKPVAAPVRHTPAKAKAKVNGKAKATRRGNAATRRARSGGTTKTTPAQQPQAKPAGPEDQATSGKPGTPAAKTDPVAPVTDAVRETTKAAADAVAPAAPGVAGALQSIGAGGAETVDKAADAVGKVVDGVVGG